MKILNFLNNFSKTQGQPGGTSEPTHIVGSLVPMVAVHRLGARTLEGY